MKFSIIVPVYRVERYLDQCVRSILVQTYADFELILVDDCSPDNCPAMCDAYARQDARVKVIHHEVNQGLGMSRNTGMAQAKGDYIFFVDSDDYISADTLRECVGRLDTGADFVVFGLTCVYQNEQGETTWTESLTAPEMTARTPEDNAAAFIQLNHARMFPFAWNKIYRRAFLESYGAAFENTKLIEDFLFNIRVFSEAKQFALMDRAFYFYRRPSHETLVSKYAPEFFDLCKRKFLLEKQFLRKCGADTPENKQVIYTSFIKHFISVIIRNHSAGANLSRKQQIVLVQEMLSDPVTREVLDSYVPKGMKMKLIVFFMRHGMARTCALIGVCADFAQTNLNRLYKKYMIR